MRGGVLRDAEAGVRLGLYRALGGEKASRNGHFAVFATSRDGCRLGAGPGRDRAAGGAGWQSRGKNRVYSAAATGSARGGVGLRRGPVLPGLRVVVLGWRSERIGALGRGRALAERALAERALAERAWA